eukprot:GILI01014328.1.p1 GENE.GILI01014328.1~~GILI01014328.1.p1  ORF type:complete len:203 (+),score=73.95 GILI01014328.1:63-671(+)
MRSAIIVFLFAAVAFSASAEKSTDPFIVVTKSVSQGDVVIGTPVTITVTASNIGQQTAHNVQLIDKHPQGENPITKSADKLANGENVTITYSFTPVEYGSTPIGVAECTYSPTAGDEATVKSISNYVRENRDLYLSEKYENPVRDTIEVMTQEQYDRLFSSKVIEFLAYLFLSGVSVVVPYLLFKSKLSQVDTLLREAKKKL